MKFNQPLRLQTLADLTNSEIIGDPNALVEGINEIHKVVAGDILFVDVEKYYAKAFKSAATYIIINKKIEAPEGKMLLYNEDPFTAYKTITQHYQKFEYIQSPVSSTAQIGEGTVIEPNVVIGEHVKIGKNCLIRANVVLHAYTEVGDNVIIHSGTIVGTDAFYYKGRPSGYEKWHSCGRVIIENDVEIGALCTIDKGVSGDTIIGEGSKLDNQCHIAHGVVIGKHCLFAAQVGIAGKTIIEDRVIMYGQSAASKSLRIGAGAVISGQSGVSKSLKGQEAYFGSPAVPIRQHHKEIATLRKLTKILPDLLKLIKK